MSRTSDDAPEIDLPDWHEAVYAVVRSIPAGKVATYGQVASLVAGYSITARQVGAALRFTPNGVPWQRVIGAAGHLPIVKRSPRLWALQRALLLVEGAVFDAGKPDRIDMASTQWKSESESEDYDHVESLSL